MTTPNITDVQERLHELGFDPGPIDGVIGPQTEAAIVAFKKSIGFRARPFLGPLTLEALWPSDNVKRNTDSSALPWMAEASRMKGLHERRNNSQLRKWFDRSVSWIDPAEIAWCGAFVATCYRSWKADIEIPENPLGARNWGKFGDRCAPGFGACLTFWRGSKSGWKGHVGFYWAEDDFAYHVLGGNQSDAVTVTRISKDRLLSARWPKGHPGKPKPILVNSKGIPLSTNEA